MKGVKKALFFPGLLFLLFSCASANPYVEIDHAVGLGLYDQGIAAIDKGQAARKPIYNEKNAVMLYLDKGILEHYAGLFIESSSDLEEAKQLIEAAFTKSISLEAASYILNDTVREYPGEDYEELFLNVVNALNYYHRDDLEGALVEIRQINLKLQKLADKYKAGSAKARNYAAGQIEGLNFTEEETSFSASALASYLSALFYRGEGLDDDVRISLAETRGAYEAFPAVYGSYPLPGSVDAEGKVPPGMARLNVVAFSGLSPVKVEHVDIIPLPLPFPNNYVKLALPQMTERPSVITRVEALIDNGPSFDLEVLEDLGRVAMETYKARYSLIVIKTLARTAVKAAATAVAARASEQSGGALAGLAAGLLGMAFTEATEHADTRMARYLPRYALVGGVNLEPGVYSVTVNYYAGARLVSSFRQEHINIRANTLNLVEAVCLQ